MTYRLGVDVGGTFTDLVLYDVDSGRLEFAKTPSTPANQSVGVVNGVRQLIERLQIAPSAIKFFIHGTTVATNTLLERKGARTALIVTEGFRDVLHIGRQDRPRLHDWRVRRPAALIPRHLCYEARERVLYTGEVLQPLTPNAVEAVVAQVRASQVNAVAICLLHSYINPTHERALGAALIQTMPQLTVVLSSDILPEFKEYERMSTTAINAYIAPRMTNYLSALQRSIVAVGIDSDLYIMQSNGGVMAATTAMERPVHTILSGPAAGVIGSVALTQQAGELNTISVDMGGTSFDICLSYQGEVRRTRESEIGGLPVKVPMVDIHTLGAGGGSIAWIDPGGALRVGPQSAGADPGPACYGRGGNQATVSDANLVLGRLSPDYFLGGRMPLDVELARRAITAHIAAPLGLSVEAAAEGIIRVVNATMIKGIRVVSVAKGYDPREFCLAAFGGAGPVHAAELANELSIPRVLVPIAPGVTSALGLLVADLRHDYVRTVLCLAQELAVDDLNRNYVEMEKEATGQMQREGVTSERLQLIRWADIRYLGQGYELEVPVASGTLTVAQLAEALERFHQAHKRQYGYARPENPVQIVNLRLTALAPLPQPRQVAEPLNGVVNPTRALKGERPVYFQQHFVATAIYERAQLVPGDSVHGPAIIEQLDSTTLVWPAQRARVDAYRNLILERTLS
jgi:N-methylhydantoinase A